jgi:Tol biopolymer transport system component
VGSGPCPRSSDGTPLTQPQDDCAQPALSPDQTEIAMICTPVKDGAPSSTEADLVVATFDAQTGALGPLDRLVTGTMAAEPAWSPDGQSLVYLAPEAPDGLFQLWYLKNATAPHPGTPQQITTNLDLTATSAPVWAAG